jgi:hypothetical protein
VNRRYETVTETTITDIVEAGELELYELPAVPTTLFGSDPRRAVARMADVAAVLFDIVHSQKLSVQVNNREYLTAEAWSALGALVGVTPVVCWVNPNETGDGYIARVEARTLDGRVIGAAESECSRAESRWKTRDSFQLRSMAQTRGVSRALRAALAVIPVLAGYEAGSSEEMADIVDDAEPELDHGKIPAERQPTAEQQARIGKLIHQLAERDPDRDWRREARRIAGCPSNMLTATIAAELIDRLEELTRA